ncbi:MAG TPA: hypothetical protein VJT73_21130 [Polyangiaceae bacterium]|nr:hypothetical protein [Polyangiaceae bacterium]
MIAVSVAFWLGACRAHVQGDAQVNAAAEVDDRKWETAESTPPPARKLAAPPPAASARTPEPPEAAHFFGVSHDLSLAPGVPRAAACQCLTVVSAAPSDPQFIWQAGVPRTSPDAIAIAIAADGVACSARGAAPLAASIAAIERRGNDVVITVENVREGRPVMRGALAPRPPEGGAIVVQAPRGAPYGAPANGGPGPCRLAAN